MCTKRRRHLRYSSIQMPQATGNEAPFGENDGSNTYGILPGRKQVLLKNCCQLSWPVRYGANCEHVEVQCDNAAVVDIVKARTSKHKDITV